MKEDARTSNYINSFIETSKKVHNNKCGGKSKLDNEKFIQKANEVHNNKYDYSKVDYKK